MAEEAEPEAATASSDQGEVREVIGSAALRPVFLGNLSNTYAAEEVTAIFEGPQQPTVGDTVYAPIPVDRIDLKRGYCFVFLKDAVTQQDKEQAELFVAALNGM
jgi:arginine/serine-rich splicing factor 4/5/6